MGGVKLLHLLLNSRCRQGHIYFLTVLDVEVSEEAYVLLAKHSIGVLSCKLWVVSRHKALDSIPDLATKVFRTLKILKARLSTSLDSSLGLFVKAPCLTDDQLSCIKLTHSFGSRGGSDTLRVK